VGEGAAMSKAEEAFARAWTERAFAPLVREHRFHPERRWRFDMAWPSIKLAVEIEGQGRHQTFTGYRGDLEKYNEAVRLGWRVLRFPASDWRKAGEWVDYVIECMCTSPER
jgi:very-short-patch-repair endonuclease